MKSMATSSSTTKTSLSPHHPPHFAPIEEGNEDEEFSVGMRATPCSEDINKKRDSDYKHHPTPLHSVSSSSSKGCPRKREEKEEATGVSCNKCRPSNRDKFCVVPLENNINGIHHRHSMSMASPNGIFKSIIASLALKKSPKSSASAMSREEHWKIVVAELSNKLVHASRKRDEAILEASKLKYSMAELEKKLNKLEIYCHSLKSGLEVCTNVNTNTNNNQYYQKQHKSPSSRVNYQIIKVGDQEKVIEHFLVLVSEARSSVRALSRALGLQLRQMGAKVHDRISSLLQDYDIKISFSRNPRGLLFYFEALLNRAFYEEFESVGFQKGGPNPILNPIDRCEANFAMFSRLKGLTWEEVLNKGTKHFSEDFSKFCDRKMSEIVAMLGWSRAWPEPLLQAFFGASKAVWLVHLLANSVHPGLPIFRVDKGVGFDPVYMEDMGGDKAKKLVPAMVRIMATPGFYVYDNVVKCKVLCRYYNSINNGGNIYDLNDKGFTPSPS
ncbi:hypothetical protein BUALT_Bualt10G0032500 [Buddleja alternifolia]|uniref:IRK-interacting protein n=1 Tax=Buddleja alternifolia TaxID=168488 RepID=A0AAV6X4D4_9LAMI|nr:hypothetical protein BUALT_Bualt10G0032500 [Buddleja alternifolia]